MRADFPIPAKKTEEEIAFWDKYMPSEVVRILPPSAPTHWAEYVNSQIEKIAATFAVPSSGFSMPNGRVSSGVMFSPPPTSLDATTKEYIDKAVAKQTEALTAKFTIQLYQVYEVLSRLTLGDSATADEVRKVLNP